MNSIDDFDGDEQPLTLDAWYARCRAELEEMRAAALAQINAHFDSHAERLALEVACIERTVADAVLN